LLGNTKDKQELLFYGLKIRAYKPKDIKKAEPFIRMYSAF